jgi:hypothetical protein
MVIPDMEAPDTSPASATTLAAAARFIIMALSPYRVDVD